MKKIDSSLNKTITMKDVAVSAGVSTATVSYVINETAPISEDTKKRVHAAISKLNYTPNALARGLRVNQTKLIGLIIPDIAVEFYELFAKGFIDAAYEKGYTVVLCGTQYDLEREQMEVATLLEKRVDGLVFTGGIYDETLITKLVESNTPIVLADRTIPGLDAITVQFDNNTVMKNLIQYIKTNNYKKIGYISEPLSMTNLIDRFNGFKEGLRENNLEYNEKYIHINSGLQLNKIENSYRFMIELIENKNDLPDVFVTTSDLISFGIIRAMTEKNIEIPEEIAVTGFDDALIASYMSPPLTTIFQDKILMGEITWDLMHRRINDEHIEQRNVLLEAKLVIRKSC